MSTYSGPRKAVTKEKYRVNHTLHLLITVFTLGLWAPVWLFVSIATLLGNALGKRRKTVTHYR